MPLQTPTLQPFQQLRISEPNTVDGKSLSPDFSLGLKFLQQRADRDQRAQLHADQLASAEQQNAERINAAQQQDQALFDERQGIRDAEVAENVESQRKIDEALIEFEKSMDGGTRQDMLKSATQLAVATDKPAIIPGIFKSMVALNGEALKESELDFKKRSRDITVLLEHGDDVDGQTKTIDTWEAEGSRSPEQIASYREPTKELNPIKRTSLYMKLRLGNTALGDMAKTIEDQNKRTAKKEEKVAGQDQILLGQAFELLKDGQIDEEGNTSFTQINKKFAASKARKEKNNISPTLEDEFFATRDLDKPAFIEDRFNIGGDVTKIKTPLEVQQEGVAPVSSGLIDSQGNITVQNPDGTFKQVAVEGFDPAKDRTKGTGVNVIQHKDGSASFVSTDETSHVLNPQGVEVFGDERLAVQKAGLEADFEFARVQAGATASGKLQFKIVQDALETVNKIRPGLTDMREAITLIDSGAKTGPIVSKLKSLRASSIALDSLGKRLALNVVQKTSFGNLSDGELAVAEAVALPKNLPPKELKTWVENRISFEEKALTYYLEAADFLSNPRNSVQDWVTLQSQKLQARRKKQRGGGTDLTKMSDDEFLKGLQQ